MNEQEIRQETQALIVVLGFRLMKASDGKYEIRNRGGKTIVRGDLQSMYYCAVYMSHDAKQNPEKYEAMNEPVDQNELYQAGLAMAKKLNQGK